MATNYTQMVTTSVVTLMRDRGLNLTSLATRSGVPRRAIESAVQSGKPWRTNHLEAIAVALDADLAAIVSPGMLRAGDAA